MLAIALCKLYKSTEKIEERISSFLGTSMTEYSIDLFDRVEEIISSNISFDLYFLHTDLREKEILLFDYIKTKEKEISKKKNVAFITYTDDPISDASCETVVDFIKRYLEYDSAYLAIEFMTDQGLRSIAISKILYFEYEDKKIKIHTKDSEYFCVDSLRNILSLVRNYAFYQPHKSFVVNFKHILAIKDYMITMNDGSLVPLSQKKSKEFRKLYKNYLKHNNARVKKVRIKKRADAPKVIPNTDLNSRK